MSNLLWSLSGIGGLLVLKYAVVGLGWWNRLFHPGRVEPAHLARFQAPVFGLSARDAIRIWIAVLDLTGLISGYEMAAEDGWFGWHTISWLSYVHMWLGYLIFFAILGVAAWWWHHFHVQHPR